MNHESLTPKQFWALSSLAVLSPLLRLLPGRTAALAGGGAWLSCLLAFGPLALFSALLNYVLRRGALADGIARAFSPRVSRVLFAALTLWFWLYGGVLLRSGAERFLTAMSVFRGWLPYAVLLLALAIPAAQVGPKPLFRAAEIFLPVLTAVLLLVLLAALPQMDWSEPGRLPKFGEVVHGAVPLWNIGCGLLFYGAFFRRDGAPNRKQSAKWLLRLCLTAAAICTLGIGVLGAEVTAKLSHPFFVLLRNLSLSSAIERFEALIAGLWVLPDFAMLSLLLLLGRNTAGRALGKAEKCFVLPGAAVMLGAAAILGKTTFRLTLWSEQIIPAATLILTIGLTLSVLAAERLNKQ